jgi:hypothetical protein
LAAQRVREITPLIKHPPDINDGKEWFEMDMAHHEGTRLRGRHPPALAADGIRAARQARRGMS